MATWPHVARDNRTKVLHVHGWTPPTPHVHLSLRESSHRACGAITDSPPTAASTRRADAIRSGAITNDTNTSRRARAMPKLRMVSTVSMLGTDTEQRRCRTHSQLAGWPPLRLQKAPRRTDVLTMATSQLAASLQTVSISASAQRSAACITALRAAADDGTTSATAK